MKIVSEKTYMLCFDTHYCLKGLKLSLTLIEEFESLLCKKEDIFTEYLSLSSVIVRVNLEWIIEAWITKI